MCGPGHTVYNTSSLPDGLLLGTETPVMTFLCFLLFFSFVFFSLLSFLFFQVCCMFPNENLLQLLLSFFWVFFALKLDRQNPDLQEF